MKMMHLWLFNVGIMSVHHWADVHSFLPLNIALKEKILVISKYEKNSVSVKKKKL